MKTVKDIKRRIISILIQHEVVKAAVFGSFARGEAKKNSDIDILVKFKGAKSLLDLVSLKMKVEFLLGRKVDLLTYDSLHPLLKDRILNEQEVFYEKRP